MEHRKNFLDKIINSFVGDMYTKRFLKSQNVRILSEGDYIHRLKTLCFATLLVPFYLIFIGVFFYYRVAVFEDTTAFLQENPTDGALAAIDMQKSVLLLFLCFAIYHLFLIFYVIIVMLNQSMGKGVTVFTSIFNILFIAEVFEIACTLFILERLGFVGNINDIDFLSIIKGKWLWIFVLVVGDLSFIPLIWLFKGMNQWQREWIRIDKYRKTDDRENGFVFRTWVTKGEISARVIMIMVSVILIIIASCFEIAKYFVTWDLNPIIYSLLISGMIMYVIIYVLPFNTYALIYFASCTLFFLGLMFYGFYVIQNLAWQAGNAYMYAYFITIPLFIMSTIATLEFWWSLRNKDELKGIVVNAFDSQDEFIDFVNNKEQREQEFATSI